MVAGAAGHLLGPMVVNPNQCRPLRLPVISDGSFLLDQIKSVIFKKSYQFAEFQNGLSYSRAFVTLQPPNPLHSQYHSNLDRQPFWQPQPIAFLDENVIRNIGRFKIVSPRYPKP